MAELKATPGQVKAMETFDRPLVVRAGAGAGKTRVLVERIANILRSGLAGPDEIAAITFTEKAANEMKARVRARLSELAGQAGSRDVARRWEELGRAIDAARISTIHGFTGGLLRENPVEAGVDPQFTILDDFEAALLAYETADRCLIEALDAGDPGAALLLSDHPRKNLVVSILGIYEKIRGTGMSLAEARALTLESCRASEAQIGGTLARLAGATERILEAGRDGSLQGKAAEEVAGLRRIWEEVRGDLEKVRASGDLWALDRVKSLKGVVSARAAAIREDVREMKETLDSLEGLALDLYSRPRLEAVFDLLAAYDAHYRAEKAGRSALDFEDLQIFARNLLKEHPAIREKYSRRLKFLMVDEFQDTNRLQKEILDLLRGSNRFVVGDPNQSIYRFRGADVSIFDEARDDVDREGGELVPLGENFRSQDRVLGFVNHLFSRLMNAYEPGLPFRKVEAAEPAVEFILCGRDPDGGGRDPATERKLSAEEARTLEAALIAARLKRMVEGGETLVWERPGDDLPERPRAVRYGDIAILFRAMSDVKVYERALRSQGIPCHVVAGSGFYEKEEVTDVLNLLRFLENRRDELSLAGVLRSPFFGLSDETLYWLKRSGAHLYDALTGRRDPFRPDQAPDQANLLASARSILERLVGLKNRVPLDELIQIALEETGYIPLAMSRFDGEQKAGNLEKLLQLARRFEAGGSHLLRDFISFVEEFLSKEGREGEAQLPGLEDGAVKIMTIHKAKGLEFPVVVLPDTARKLKKKNKPPLIFDPEIGLGIKVRGLDGDLAKPGLWTRVAEREETLEIHEYKRILYVGTTRARDYLIVCGTAQEIKTGRDIEEMDSWLEWLCRIFEIQDTGEIPPELECDGGRIRMITRAADLLEGVGSLEEKKAPSDLTVEPEERATEGAEPRVRPPVQSDRPGIPGTPIPVTALMTYERCPRRYYLERVVGYPSGGRAAKKAGSSADFSSANLSRLNLSAAVRGSIAHRVLQWLSSPSEAERVTREVISREGIIEPASAKRAFAEVYPLIRKYLGGQVFAEVLRARESGIAVESEKPFLVRVVDYLISGTIDKIIPAAEGKVRIVDFKTNEIPPGKVEEVAREYILQIQAYSMAAERLWGYRVKEGLLYFLYPDVTYPVSIEAVDRGALEARILGLCRGASAPGGLVQFEARRGDACFRCPVLEPCRMLV